MIFRSSIILVLAGIVCLACRLSPESRLGGECGVLMKLPEAAGEFSGKMGIVSTEERNKLPEDTEMARMEYSTAGRPLSERDAAIVSVVLAGSQRRSIHRPEVCLTGQGWTMLDARTVTIQAAPGKPLQVRDLLVEKPVTFKDGTRRNLRAHYVYWFVGADVATPSNFDRMWLSTWDCVLRNVNHRWAYPSVMAYVTESFDPKESGERRRTADETFAMIEKLIREIAPKFQKSLMEPRQLAAAR